MSWSALFHGDGQGFLENVVAVIEGLDDYVVGSSAEVYGSAQLIVITAGDGDSGCAINHHSAEAVCAGWTAGDGGKLHRRSNGGFIFRRGDADATGWNVDADGSFSIAAAVIPLLHDGVVFAGGEGERGVEIRAGL